MRDQRPPFGAIEKRLPHAPTDWGPKLVRSRSAAARASKWIAARGRHTRGHCKRRLVAERLSVAHNRFARDQLDTGNANLCQSPSPVS